MSKLQKIILGIDPGTLQLGYAIIAVKGQEIKLIEMQTIRMSSKSDNHERLLHIHKVLVDLINQYKPHDFAIEAPFFGKNVQSMLKLGRAQGVAIATAMSGGLPVTEYSPRKIKQAITGKGNSDKEQVWKMLKQMLGLTEEPDYYDATDALAIAVCHHFQSSSPGALAEKKFNGWDDYIKKNSQKVRSR